MKVIVYERPDGGCSVVHPSPFARLVSVDGVVVPFDVLRRTMQAESIEDIPGAEWAETEDEFVQRIRDKDVPADATKVEIMNAADLPPRESRKYWRLA